MLKKSIALSAFFFAAIFSLHAQWEQVGIAAYYADKLHGRPTSSGEIYDKKDLTCAHGSLPVGSIIRVTRVDNGEWVNVRVNDCCVSCAKGDKGHVVDLSRAAAERITMIKDGQTKVKVELMVLGDGKPCCGKSVQAKTPANYSGKTDKLTSKGVTPAQKQQSPVGQGTYNASALKPIEKGFGVQVGAFGDMDNAERRIEELGRKGFKNLLINIDNSKPKAPYRVFIGPFETRNSAQIYANSLMKKYKIKGFIQEI
ncbi:MAG: septal ring lytic transglycosylase RlpA family protein [Saprospiraceae bacterium]|nr:septal ring lytic transglycosylase RlpA family protein [Saprospiraceae bacterium]